MKKKFFTYLFVILSFSSLVSCKNLYDEFSDYSYGNQFSGMILYDSGLEFGSMEEIGSWIQKNITYEKSYKVTGPEETIAAGSGDCKSISVLFMNLAYFSLGVKCDLVCVDISSVSKGVVEGGRTNHCMVMYDDLIYEPQNGLRCSARIGYKYSFDHVFSK